MADHTWRFFAVPAERAIRAVVICTTCGEGRWKKIDPNGGDRLPLAGECPGSRSEPAPRVPVPVVGLVSTSRSKRARGL